MSISYRSGSILRRTPTFDRPFFTEVENRAGDSLDMILPFSSTVGLCEELSIERLRFRMYELSVWFFAGAVGLAPMVELVVKGRDKSNKTDLAKLHEI